MVWVMLHLGEKGTQEKDLWKKSASNSLQQIKSELTANLKRPIEIGKQETTFDLIWFYFKFWRWSF